MIGSRSNTISSQSHHIGIETGEVILYAGEKPALNRTILELKQVLGFSEEEIKDALNRTILELKRSHIE